MVHQFDHRAASVEVNLANLHNAALSGDIGEGDKANPSFVPTPLYWVPEAQVIFPDGLDWTLTFRDIARATDSRTMIAAVTDRDNVAYIYSTFPIQERQETLDHGRYLSRDLCLEYLNILAAGQPDDEPVLA